MDRFIEFVANNWWLALAFVGVVVAIVVNELRQLKAGAGSLDPAAAIQLYNRQDAQFVDVRPEADYRKSHLPGAINLPATAVAERIGKLDRFKDKPVIVYCANAAQSGRVAAELAKQGFATVYQLRGGLANWLSAGYPLASK